MKTATPKSKKGWIIAIVLIVLAIIIILVIVAKKKKKAVTTTATTDDRVLATGAIFPIKYGDRSEYVKRLQEWLFSKGATLPVYGIDGIFGDETRAALLAITGKDTVDYNTYVQITG